MQEYLSLVPGEIPTGKLHGHLLSVVAPRPIALASTVDAAGRPNLAPFSFFNIFSSNPPVAIFAPNRRVRDNTSKHTVANLRQVPEVVINVVSHAIMEQMNLSSTEYPAGVNEFVKAGFTELASDLVRPPRVGEAPAQLECRVMEIKPLSNAGGGGQLVICRIVKVHINKSVLGPDGTVDYNKIDLVARMGKDFYSRTSGDAVFELLKPTGSMNVGFDGMPAAVRNSEILSGNDLGKLGLQAALPSAVSVAAFAAAEAGGLLKGVGNVQQAHALAKELLKANEVERAWLVLLAAERE